MNSLTRLWWTAKAVGWDNVPRRLLQSWRVKSGWLRRRTDPSRFTDEVFRVHVPLTIDEQPVHLARASTAFLHDPGRQATANRCRSIHSGRNMSSVSARKH